jgi:hypothetical protein
MSTPPVSPPVSRYVALDVHRRYLVVGAVDIHQQIVLPPRRFGFESFQLWVARASGPDRRRCAGGNLQCLVSA